jgi:hypothetical protein
MDQMKRSHMFTPDKREIGRLGGYEFSMYGNVYLTLVNVPRGPDISSPFEGWIFNQSFEEPFFIEASQQRHPLACPADQLAGNVDRTLPRNRPASAPENRSDRLCRPSLLGDEYEKSLGNALENPRLFRDHDCLEHPRLLQQQLPELGCCGIT